MSERELTRKQVAAIKKSAVLGLQIQREHPEVAEAYRRGYSLSEIVTKFDLNIEYSCGLIIARNAVNMAISGFRGGCDTEPYVGLISDEDERKELNAEHNKTSGLKLYEDKKAIHGLTEEQRIENASKAGKTAKALGKGVHGRTPEQMTRDAEKSLRIQGKIPWTDEERDLAYELSLKPEYQNESGRWAGKPNYLAISTELSRRGYPSRTKIALRSEIRRLALETRTQTAH